MDCDNTRRYYRAYGVAELLSQPRAEMATISQAKTFARSEMSKMISSRALDVMSGLTKTKTENGEQKLQQNILELIEQTSLNMLEDTETHCIETQITSRKGDKGSKKYIVTKVCLQMSKETFSKSLYSAGKEVFTNLNIDYETLEIKMSGGIRDKK